MAKIILFQNTNFTGDACVLKDADIRNLSNKSFNDRASSVIVIDGSWTLYQHAEFGGARWYLQANGGPERDGCYPSYNDWQGSNDSVSSVRRGIDR